MDIELNKYTNREIFVACAQLILETEGDNPKNDHAQVDKLKAELRAIGGEAPDRVAGLVIWECMSEYLATRAARRIAEAMAAQQPGN